MWDHIRRWLIRKLGGYAEPSEPITEQKYIEVQQIMRNIVPVTASVLIPISTAKSLSHEELDRLVKQKLADEIARELVSSKAICHEQNPCLERCMIRFTGWVYIAMKGSE